jgi:integrase/recombinase XerC
MSKFKMLTASEEEKLRESLKFCSPRDRLIVKILLDYGPRGAELREILRSDIDLEAQTITIGGKKGSESRQFPILPALLEELEAYVRSLDIAPHEPIFELSASGLKKVWYRVRPCLKGVHSLRHTFAVNLYRRTRDIRMVQVCLGHRSIQNTLVYAQFVDSTERIREIFLPGESHVS